MDPQPTESVLGTFDLTKENQNSDDQCMLVNKRTVARQMYLRLKTLVIDGQLDSFFAFAKHLIPIPNQENDSLLHLAIIHQPLRLDFIQTLLRLSQLLPNNPINEQNNLRQTPLHIAAILKNSQLVKKLLKHGADPNITDHRGNTCLHLAATFGDVTTLKVILDSSNYKNHIAIKLNANILNHDGFSSLHLAIINQHQEIIQVLCTHRCEVDLNLKDGKGGRSPLHLAIIYDPSLVKELLKNKEVIDLHQKDYAGNTPFHLAKAFALDDDIIQLMLDAGHSLAQDNKLDDQFTFVSVKNILTTYSKAEMVQSTGQGHWLWQWQVKMEDCKQRGIEFND